MTIYKHSKCSKNISQLKNYHADFIFVHTIIFILYLKNKNVIATFGIICCIGGRRFGTVRLINVEKLVGIILRFKCSKLIIRCVITTL